MYIPPDLKEYRLEMHDVEISQILRYLRCGLMVAEKDAEQ